LHINFSINASTTKMLWSSLIKSLYQTTIDAPPNSLKDPNVGHGVKQWKKKKIKAHSLTCNILKEGGHARAPKWD